MADRAASFECLRAAGCDPDLLADKRLVVAGGGNAGANIVLSTTVLGIPAAYVDLDRVEAKNLPHSPFLDVTPMADGEPPFKAELLARAHVAYSRAVSPFAYWAGVPLQSIGLGALRRFHGLMVGIDDGTSRAYAVHVGAMLGLPTIVAGFYPPAGNFACAANANAEDPCLFCLRPEASRTRASCSLYRSAPGERVNPALQTAAAATMNVALEAMVRIWHGDRRYDGKVFRLDLGEGNAELTSFRRHPDCPGPHEIIREVTPTTLTPEATAEAVLGLATKDGLREPRLELQSPLYVSMPCARCGAPIEVVRPNWAVRTAPVCANSCEWHGPGSEVVTAEIVSPGTALAAKTLRELGLGPLGLCFVEDAVTDELRVYELPGSLEDVFQVITRAER